jgi:drug/metabolite transporter (DMT)-like permease
MAGTAEGAASPALAARLDLAANAAAAFAAVLFGASVVAVRIAVRDVPPLGLAFLRFGQGALLLLVGLALLRPVLLRVAPRDVPYLLLLGVLFYAIFPVTFNAGLQYVDASRGAIVLATMPLFTLVLARRAAGERLLPRQVIGVLTSFAGVAVIMADRSSARDPSGESMRGYVLLLTTALCGATYNVLAKRILARYSGLTVSVYAMTFGALCLAPLSIGDAARVGALPSETLAAVVFLGVLGGALGYSLWTTALARLSPTEASVYINLNPVAATLLGAMLLHEHLTARFGLGFVAVAGGVMVVNWSRRTKVDQVRDGPQIGRASPPASS